MARIRVGIGGWVFAPWRGSFYPEGLKQAKELDYASSRLSSIEINGTFYGAQKLSSFEKWHRETPADFVFSVKGTRYATYRTELGEAGPSVERFFSTGVLALKEKLGPILWQLPGNARFDAGRLEAFLQLLPKEREGLKIRHVFEAPHESFASQEALDLLRKYGVAVPMVDSEGRVLVAERTADFLYVRLRRAVEEEPAGYSPEALQEWAEKLKAAGVDCFVYFINGAKIRCPAAAQALIKLL
jgi:uncharacterized protein YecE (DUF72 family)